MIRISTFFQIIFFSIYLYTEIDAQQNILTPKEKADGWILLFDGQTTNGWRGFKMDEMPADWSVKRWLPRSIGNRRR